MGQTFKGVYNLYDKSLYTFLPGTEKKPDGVHINNLEDPLIDKLAGNYAAQLREDVDLIEGVYEPFDVSPYREGKIAPVFFGSAINNFGVKELLDTFIAISPEPGSRPTDKREVKPEDKQFSGFIFKIHANLDPRHRDRIAFLRVCSGKFERGKFYHHVRLDKDLRFNNPATFLGQSKSIVDEAFPGDVIGLYDAGNFKIGDTLTEGEELQFQGIPSFSPEIFKELVNTDPMKTKQLDKGITQLTDEGVAQLFIQYGGNRKIVGTVGELQFEVIQYRLEHEYGAACKFNMLNVYKACWITSEDPAKLDEFVRFRQHQVASDKDGNLVYLADSQWMLDQMIKNHPEVAFHFTSEFKRKKN